MKNNDLKIFEYALSEGNLDYRAALNNYYHSLGFTDLTVTHVDDTDGLRLTLGDGAIVHLRPSGNAPELRCYAEADGHAAAQSVVTRMLAALKLYPCRC